MPRTSSSNSQRQWLLGGAALVVATGVGFGIAKLTTPKPTPTEAAAEAARLIEAWQKGDAPEEPAQRP